MGWKMVRDKQPEWAGRHSVSGQWRVAADPATSLRRKLIE